MVRTKRKEIQTSVNGGFTHKLIQAFGRQKRRKSLCKKKKKTNKAGSGGTRATKTK